MESLGLNAVAAAKSASAHRLLWFSSFGAKPDNQARFSRRHPVIDEAVRASGTRRKDWYRKAISESEK
jgi:uncharacterized protein YbjT (DUF2867 family)